MIQITTGDSRPIFKQIVDGVMLKIASGELSDGDKLPSVRSLAMLLMVNTNTVAKAYGELTTLGVVEAKKGLGLFVCAPKDVLSKEEKLGKLDDAITHLVSEIVPLGLSQKTVVERLEHHLAALKAKSVIQRKNDD